ncbi:hypothetical protein RN001_003519 [Aquatica leii]|uniref:Regulatory protein zeste n=1 Tax=Aquatica leii TaxID=1421715 RepID=A0AAN7SRM0_9COLE|nr:hypothetical protein RN001_003519 [Aquatica leii]
MQDMAKRIKGKNFTDREISLLLDNIEKFVNIIENKKTDSVAIKEKTKTWDIITTNFNRLNEDKRSVYQLKKFYGNFKRKTRKAKLHIDEMADGFIQKTLSEHGKRLESMLKDKFRSDSDAHDSETDIVVNDIEPLREFTTKRNVQVFFNDNGITTNLEKSNIQDVVLNDIVSNIQLKVETIDDDVLEAEAATSNEFCNLDDTIESRKRKCTEETEHSTRKEDLSLKVLEQQLKNSELEGKILETANIGRQLQQHSIVTPDSTHFLKEVVAGMKCENYDCPISIHYGQVNDIKKLSVYQLMMEFAYCDWDQTAGSFINFCKSSIPAEMIEQAEKLTSKKFNSLAMSRGRNLEHDVLCEVEKMLKCKGEKCGFTILKNFGIIGASPDGITKDAVIEVKYPISNKTFMNYI